MATFVFLRHPVTTLVTYSTNPNNLTNDISVTTKSNKCYLFQTLRNISVNKNDLRALNLVGPTRQNPVTDPLAVLHLYKSLYFLK